LLLIASEINPPVDDHRFVSILWECDDQTASKVSKTTKKVFVKVKKHPEVGVVWV